MEKTSQQAIKAISILIWYTEVYFHYSYGLAENFILIDDRVFATQVPGTNHPNYYHVQRLDAGGHATNN